VTNLKHSDKCAIKHGLTDSTTSALYPRSVAKTNVNHCRPSQTASLHASCTPIVAPSSGHVNALRVLHEGSSATAMHVFYTCCALSERSRLTSPLSFLPLLLLIALLCTSPIIFY
jgi:hypothetical protein